MVSPDQSDVVDHGNRAHDVVIVNHRLVAETFWENAHPYKIVKLNSDKKILVYRITEKFLLRLLTRFEISQQPMQMLMTTFGMQWKLLCKDCTKLAALYTPVSYTHLDVYKRQPAHRVSCTITYC